MHLLRSPNVASEEYHTDRTATISDGGYLWWELLLPMEQMTKVCIVFLRLYRHSSGSYDY